MAADDHLRFLADLDEADLLSDQELAAERQTVLDAL
jgi:hypothetical protein